MTPVSFSRRRVAQRLLPLLCVLLLVSGCLCGGEGVNEGDVNLISMEEEWQLGQRLAQRIEQQMPMVEGPVRQYVQQIGGQLVRHTDLADRPWTFHVVASDEVNAFAIPGGHVYVHTGLIQAASTPSELAGVLAHEVAHGAARHSTERLTKVYGLNTGLGLITGEESGLIEQILTRLGQRGTIAKFSRDDEREADRLGLGYLAEAGYDPRGMVRFFETLLQRRRDRPNALEQFFSSHPLTEERLQAARQHIEQLPASADGSKGPAPEANLQRFRRVQQRLQQRTRP